MDLVAWTLELNPQRRWDVSQLLGHPWFREERARFSDPAPSESSTAHSRDKTEPCAENAVLNKAKALLHHTQSTSSIGYAPAPQKPAPIPTGLEDFNFDMIGLAKPAPKQEPIKNTKDLLANDDIDMGGLDMLDEF